YRLERQREVARGLPSLVALLFKTMADDPLDARWNVAAGGREICRIIPQHRAHHLGRRSTGECARARDHLVEDCAEREDIRSVIDGLTAQLFRRHIADGA